MERCPLCPNVNDPLPCEGPTKCDIFFVGEAPGASEQKQKRIFIGKTGQELNDHYLPLAGLRRSNVRIGNAIKCLPPGHGGRLDSGRNKDIELLMACASHSLYSEIQEVSPRLIVPMGAFACQAIDPDIQLDLQHGIPLETSWGTVFPMWHPSAGLHEPKRMLLIRNDWIRLGKYLKGKLRLPKDECPIPQYMPVTFMDHKTFDGGAVYRPMACDTEITGAGNPYCLTYSVEPGHGRLIKADDPDGLYYFQKRLNERTGPILFHNWLFDKHVVEAMRLRFPEHLIVDTMVMAFHLGNLPQGLKALARRELGMTMDDFSDVVTPYSLPIALEYLRAAQEIDWPKPEEQLVRDEDGKWKMYKPQSMSTKLKRFFTDYAKNPNKDVFDMWANNWEDSHAQIEAVLGPWPGRCITHVPFDKVIHYACRDADATLRLWHRLQGMTRKVRKTLQENWGD